MISELVGNALGRIDFYTGVLSQDYGKRALKDYKTFSVLKNTLKPYIGELKEKLILDIGCGRRYPYTLLLHSLGNTVVGIDTDYIAYNDSLLKRHWKELKQNGFESFGRALLYELLKQKSTYYKTLQKLCDFPLNYERLIFKRMNAENMAFSAKTFDLAVSILCFEHIANVPKAISEVHRVLKKGGFAYIMIHLFASRSGAHHVGKQLDRVPPWDHLRQKRYTVPVYLNKLRKDEWLRLFSKRFEIIEVLRKVDKEGKNLLTSEILAELLDYSRDELLTSTITIVAQKR